MGEPGTGEGISNNKREVLDPPTLEPVAHVIVSVGGINTLAEIQSDTLRQEWKMVWPEVIERPGEFAKLRVPGIERKEDLQLKNAVCEFGVDNRGNPNIDLVTLRDREGNYICVLNELDALRTFAGMVAPTYNEESKKYQAALLTVPLQGKVGIVPVGTLDAEIGNGLDYFVIFGSQLIDKLVTNDEAVPNEADRKGYLGILQAEYKSLLESQPESFADKFLKFVEGDDIKATIDKLSPAELIKNLVHRDPDKLKNLAGLLADKASNHPDIQKLLTDRQITNTPSPGSSAEASSGKSLRKGSMAQLEGRVVRILEIDPETGLVTVNNRGGDATIQWTVHYEDLQPFIDDPNNTNKANDSVELPPQESLHKEPAESLAEVYEYYPRGETLYDITSSGAPIRIVYGLLEPQAKPTLQVVPVLEDGLSEKGLKGKLIHLESSFGSNGDDRRRLRLGSRYGKTPVLEFVIRIYVPDSGSTRNVKLGQVTSKSGVRVNLNNLPFRLNAEKIKGDRVELRNIPPISNTYTGSIEHIYANDLHIDRVNLLIRDLEAQTVTVTNKSEVDVIKCDIAEQPYIHDSIFTVLN